MPARRPAPAAGGALIAIGTIVGTGIGLATAQVTIGFLVGLGVGVLAAVAIWLAGRR